MNILVTSDTRNLRHAYVMLVSLLENTPDEIVNVYYFHNGIDDTQIEEFKAFFNGKLAHIEFIKLEMEAFEGLNYNKRIPVIAYFRIKCADLLPADVKRILYLDPDIIVLKSLKGLYDTDLKDKYLGAVEDFFPFKEKLQYLSIPDKYRYFNSGVLLIDVEKFRQNHVSEKVFDYARGAGERLLCHDQDALNAVLFEKWIPLDPRWNVTTVCYQPHNFKLDDPDTIKPPEDPAVIHYVCDPKPWEYLSEHPLKDEYWRYLAKTPFKTTIPDGFTLKNIIKKARKRIKRRLFQKLRG